MYFSVILLYIVVFWRATSLLALGYYVLPSFINKGFIIIIIMMLAITWSCDKFDQYLYGRDIVTIETDHEPLKSVFKNRNSQVTQAPAANASGPTKVQP